MGIPHKVLEISKDKLWVTVYHTDDEAFDLWQKIAGIPDHRIIRISTLDNFWSAGDVGPCGPCSEIFYDHGDHVPGALRECRRGWRPIHRALEYRIYGARTNPFWDRVLLPRRPSIPVWV